MSIELWLKETIPGIIILGALGGFLAIFVIWLAKRYLPAFVRRVISAAVVSIAGLLSAPVAKKQARLYLLKKGENKYLVFYSLQVMKLVFNLAISTWFLVFFLYSLNKASDTLLQPPLYLSAMGFFVFFWWALRALMEAIVPHVIDMDALIRKSAEKVGLTNDSNAS